MRPLTRSHVCTNRAASWRAAAVWFACTLPLGTASADPSDCALGGGFLGGTLAFSGADATIAPSGVNGTADLLADAMVMGQFGGGAAPDLVIGAPYVEHVDGGSTANDAGAVYIFFDVDASVSAGTIDVDTADITLYGDLTGYAIGRDLSVGDVDGDGDDDLMVGSMGAGKAWVIDHVTLSTLSGASTIDSVASTVLLQRASGVQFGWEVELADVTGDGLDDAIVSAIIGTTSTTGEGEVYVFPSPLGSSLTAGTDDRVRIYGGSSAGRFGYPIVNLGDLDGTGMDVVAIGALTAGKVYLWNGDAGWSTGSAEQLTASDATHLRTLFTGGSTFGQTIASAGDVTGDGVPDLWIGEPAFATQSPGIVRLFSGALTGSQTTAATWTALQSSVNQVRIGTDVIGDLDLDGDGFLDMVAWGDKGSPDGKGAAFVTYGPFVQGATRYTAAIDGRIDGSDSSIYYNGTPLHYNLLARADIDLDGFDDVLLAYPTDGSVHTYGGSIGIFRGGREQAVNYYPDADGDGYGDSDDPVFDCAPPVGYVEKLGPPPPSVATIDGIDMELTITSHADGEGVLPGATTVRADLGVGVDVTAPTDDVALSIVVDLSPSAFFVTSSTTCGDRNGDGVDNQDFDCQIVAVENLLNAVIASGSVDEVSLVFFESLFGAADLSPDAGAQVWVAPDADADADGTLDVLEAMASMSRAEDPIHPYAGPSAFTTYNVATTAQGSSIFGAVHHACDLLDGSSASLKRILVVSDGYNTTSWNQTAAYACLAENGIAVSAFVTGTHAQAGCDSPYGTGEFGTMDEVTGNTGGSCIEVGDGSALPDILPAYVGPQVTDVRAYLDGLAVDPSSVSVAPPLVHEGFGLLELSVDVDVVDTAQVCFEADVVYLETQVTVGDCVGLRQNHPPTVTLSAPSVTPHEGQVVTLVPDTEDVDVDDTLTYSWSVVPTSGLPVTGVSQGQDQLSFIALDDGIYDVTVTVSDGWASATDTVEVTVDNAEPVATVLGHNGLGDGVVTLTGRIADDGPVDTHTVEIDWGDGSAPEIVDPVASGPGWAGVLASHVFAGVGSHTVLLTITDGDGGVDVQTVDVTTTQPVAMWANGGAVRKALEWSGCSGVVRGDVYSAGDLWIGGGGKAVEGRIVSGDVHLRGDVSLSDAPAATVPSSAPVWFDVADWAPGSAKALAYGDTYHEVTACPGGVWTVDSVLEPGVYYTTCPIDVTVDVQATLVSTASIRVSADDLELSAYGDALLLLAGDGADDAVSIVGSNVSATGYLAAPSGGVEVGGQLFTLTCGVVADRIDFAGSGLSLDATACSTANAGAMTPLLAPELAATVEASPADALPGEQVDATLDVAFDGLTLVVPAVVSVRNQGVASVSVTGVDVLLEARPTALDPWQSLTVDTDWTASPLLTGTGMTPDLTQGTPATVDAGAFDVWSVSALVHAADTDLGALLVAAAGGELRATVGLAVSNPTSEPVSVQGHDTRVSVDTGAVSIDDLSLSVLGVDGGSAFLGSGELGTLDAGDAVSASHTTAPVVLASRGLAESNAHYLDRLRAADGQSLPTAVLAVGTFNGTRAYSPIAVDLVTQQVPVLEVADALPDGLVVAASDVVDLSTTISNVGAADAVGVVLAQSVGTDVVSSTLPTLLAGGSWAAADSAYTVPSSLAGSTPSVLRNLAWTDALGNLYGTLSEEGDLDVTPLPGLDVTLVDVLQDDADANGVFTAGDTARLLLQVTPVDGVAVADVEVSLPLDANVSLVADSASATLGSVTVDTSGAAPVVKVSLASLGGTQVLEAQVDVVLPSGVSQVVHQAAVTSELPDAVVSDDPGTPGAANPTRTNIFPAGASLEASLLALVVTDTDGNGGVSPGDVVHYELTLFNRGLTGQADLDVSLPVPGYTTLVAGSLVTDADVTVSGTAAEDSSVHVTHALLGQTSSIRVGFDVTLELGSNIVGQVSTQAIVADENTMAQLAVSDDPRTDTEDDATVLAVGDPPYPASDDPEIAGEWPTAEILTPEDGDRVATPVDVVVHMAPVEGYEIQFWRAVLVPGNADATAQIAIGSGLVTPAGDVTVGRLDPTTLANGIYNLQVDVLDTTGRVRTDIHAVLIDGDFKPGRLTLAFQDFSVPTPMGPVSLVRRYDSLDRLEDGDFGHGWSLQLSDLRIQTNGPIGWGGWSRYVCGGGFGILQYCFAATGKPHVVVLTWPDGRQEVFDVGLTPTNSLAPISSTLVFTGRDGTSSTLAVRADDPAAQVGWQDNGDVHAGALGTAGIADPQRFVVTTSDGTEWEVDVDDGLQKMTDRFGNTLEISDTGLVSSLGPDMTFTRTSSGRIASVALPDATTLTYTYDAMGDLRDVEDQIGQHTAFIYDDGHRLLTWEGEGAASASEATYDSEGRLIEQRDPMGLGFEETQDLTTLTTTRYEPDATSPELTTVTTYGEDGTVTSVAQSFIDPDSVARVYTTTYEWDDAFRPTRVVYPSGGEELFAYDGLGRVTQHTDAAGVVTEKVYGPHDVVVETWVGTGVERQLEERQVLDGEDRVMRIERGDGSTKQRFGYDSASRLAWMENGAGERIWVQAYAAQGMPSDLQLPGGEHVTVTYDGAGRKRFVTRPVVGTTEYRYDGLGRMTALIDPLGGTQAWSYPDVHTQVYADKGAVAANPTNPSPVTTSVYDDGGRMVSQTNRLGQLLSYTYDWAGRTLTVTGPDVSKTFAYDALGRLWRAETSDHVHVQTWDASGLVSTHAYSPTNALHADASMGYVFDDGGRLSSTTGPEHSAVTYGYDTQTGQLATLSDAVAGVFTLDVDVNGRLQSLSRGNGTTTSVTYDGSDRVLSMVTSLTGTTDPPVHALTYSYDPVRGFPSSMTDGYGTHTYTHDPIGRLLAASHSGTTSGLPEESYTYDEAYRRTSWSGNSAGSVSYTSADQLSADATYSYGYDAEGRRVSQASTVASGDTGDTGTTTSETTYAWNSLGQLVGMVEPDGTSWTYGYDALDRRVLVTRDHGVSPQTWTFAYDVNGLARAMYDGSGTVLAEYVVGRSFGTVLAELDGTGTVVRYPLRDKLGTVVAWLDDGGALVEDVVRDSYGVRRDGPASDVVPYGYTGHAEDPTGLVWGRARYLEPEIGAWLSEDPVWEEPRTVYGQGRPTFLVDVDGKSAIEFALCAAAVVVPVAMTAWAYRTMVMKLLGVPTEALANALDNNGGGAGPVVDPSATVATGVGGGIFLGPPLGGLVEGGAATLILGVACLKARQ
ncbi:MAG: RHS repeat protein [Alphaproteobacteria bacterium]|nr:RHS repeat protein [Alphaproteobacteria bacterium]